MGKDDSPPPYDPTNYKHYNHASMSFYPPQGMGVSATHVPVQSSGATPSGEGFNVWSVSGYTGFVKMPESAHPTEIMGRLETMKQVMHKHHDFDPSKLPRPPTPSDEDMEKDKKAKEKKEEDKKKPARQALTIDPPPPPPKLDEEGPDYGDPDLKCVICDGDKGWGGKKIKRIGDQIMCWYCVCASFKQEARRVWWGL